MDQIIITLDNPLSVTYGLGHRKVNPIKGGKATCDVTFEADVTGNDILRAIAPAFPQYILRKLLVGYDTALDGATMSLTVKLSDLQAESGVSVGRSAKSNEEYAADLSVLLAEVEAYRTEAAIAKPALKKVYADAIAGLDRQIAAINAILKRRATSAAKSATSAAVSAALDSVTI